MISRAPQWHYRRAGLGYLVRQPISEPWAPPPHRPFDFGPGLIPPDPATLRRVIEGLKRL